MTSRDTTERRGKEMAYAVLAILANLPMAREGMAECPVCGKNVKWKRHPHTGDHKDAITMACETPDCVAMEGH